MIPNSNSGLSIAANIGGAFILRNLLWNKYIGKDVKYTPKPVLIPALIGIAIVAVFLLAIFAKV